MKGKDIFTKEEYEAIVRLLKSKVRSDKSGKKSIRAKIRKFGFHCSDFKNNAGDEFDVNDFKQLVKSNTSVKIYRTKKLNNGSRVTGSAI